MINCIVVDDEKHARLELIYHLSKSNKFNIIGDFNSAKKTKSFFIENDVDIIFIDINLHHTNGICLAKELLTLKEDSPYIVFVTAYDEYAVEAFEVNALDYILKPIKTERFEKFVKKISSHLKKDQFYKDKIMALQNKNCDVISLSKNGVLYPIKKIDIILSYIDNRELIIITKKSEFKLNTTLNYFENQLSNKNFMRVHRSYLININYIEKIIPWFNSTYKVKLEYVDIEIPISRKNTSKFKDLMSIL